MGLLGLAGSLLGMIPKVGSPGGAKKGKSGGSKGKSSKKSSKKKSSTKKKQKKSSKKKKKKKRKKKKKKKKWGKFFTKARKLKNSLSKSKLVKRAKKAIKKAILTTKKVVKKAKAAVTKAKQQVKAAVKQTKQVVKEKVLPVVKKAAQATKKPTNSSSTKAKTASVDKNRITSEAELKALLDEHRKTRVIGSDGEPITTLADKRKVLSAESTVTPDGLYPYVMLGSKMSYALFLEDYLKVSDANAPIKENFEAAVSLINPVRKVKKGEEVLENVRKWEKVIEETYGLANNSQKAKDAKTTQKEIDQLGEYVKKLDKGTGKNETGWDIPRGGGEIGGRRYSEHSLERMAPNLIQVNVELEKRAIEKGLKPGTKEFEKFVDPRGVPPMVVEDTIRNVIPTPGNRPNTLKYDGEAATVITNTNGDVITVIPKGSKKK